MRLVRLGRARPRRRRSSRREPPAGDLVERIADEREVLRLLDLGPVEAGGRRELDRDACRRSRSTGRASATSVEIGIDLPLTASTTLRCQASRSWSSSSGGGAASPFPPVATGSGAPARRPRRGAGAGSGTGAGGAGLDSAVRGRPCGRDSSSSSRWASDSRERSACGRVILTSASSSGSRGSPPWRMSSTATASRSIRRSTVGSGSWFACSRRRSRVSSVTRQRLRDVADVLDEQELAEVLDQLGDEPTEVLTLLGELLDLDERAGGVAVDDRVAEAEERVLLDPADELEHVLHGDRLAGRGGELVERRDRVAERAVGAARDQREGGVGRVDASRPRTRGAGRRRAPAGAAAGRRTSGSASAPSAARSRDRSCRRRRRGGAEAPRSASAARSTPAT